jgi:hypothetical protein
MHCTSFSKPDIWDFARFSAITSQITDPVDNSENAARERNKVVTSFAKPARKLSTCLEDYDVFEEHALCH